MVNFEPRAKTGSCRLNIVFYDREDKSSKVMQNPFGRGSEIGAHFKRSGLGFSEY